MSKMASKKDSTDEKAKVPKKGFFRRSESVMPDNYSKTVSDSISMGSTSNDSENRKIIRRSSMICSEGFDKYTFDCHKQNSPKSIGLKLDVNIASQGGLYSQNQSSSEKNAVSGSQTPSSVSEEQTGIRKLSPFKPFSVTTPNKNAPVPFKRVPEETIPVNLPLTSKSVPTGTVHFADTNIINTPPKSPVTSIPISFNPIPQIPNRITNASVSFIDNHNINVPTKSPVTSVPLSYNSAPHSPYRITNASVSFSDPYSVNIYPKSSSASIPSSFSPVPESPSRIINSSTLKTSPMKTVPVRNSPVAASVSFADTHPTNVARKSHATTNLVPDSSNRTDNNIALKTSPTNVAQVKNSSVASKKFSDEHDPVRHSPLSFKQVPQKSRPVTKAFSFRNASDDLTPNKNISVSTEHISDQFNPSRHTPLSFKNAPKQTFSNNYVSDEPIPIRSTPLSMKGESVSLRNIPSSLKHFDNESSPIRNMALSLQPVPEEPASTSDYTISIRNNTPDEPIPFRNSPLTLKPMLTKHMSLLKKKTPSFKGHIIKRDSVVHPGRVDMQGSLFIDGRFQNPWPTWRPPTFVNFLKFGVTRNKSKVPPKQELDLVLPIVKQNFSKLTIPEEGIRVTWIGHSTVLVQMHGLNIMTDPIFSDRASPSQVVGPKRYREPPCTIHDLPHINAVVISHTHYDHLDYNTVTLLNARFGSDLRWFVPLGLQTWMEEIGCENVVELDWWEENCVPEHSDTSFIFTPAQHWSKRTIGDDNKVLWGSWCVLGPKYKFFFAGDTGYCEAFKQIGRVHGPFDLSAIPIGAYEPRWFMKYQHINPEEAVKIHMDVKSKRSLAIHWGTFSLANEYYLDPPVKLRESLDKCEIPPELFFTMKHGESRLIAQNNLVKKQPLSERNGKES